MKVKVYKVTVRHKCQDNTVFYVDAPNKCIAKWCGANLFNNEWKSFLTAKDIKVERFKYNDGTRAKKGNNK